MQMQLEVTLIKNVRIYLDWKNLITILLDKIRSWSDQEYKKVDEDQAEILKDLDRAVNDNKN